MSKVQIEILDDRWLSGEWQMLDFRLIDYCAMSAIKNTNRFEKNTKIELWIL